MAPQDACLQERMKSIRPPRSMQLAETVRKMKSVGRRVIDLTWGAPHLNPDPRIVDAAHKAMRDGHNGYTHSRGIPEIRRAIARHLEEDYGVRYDPEKEILVSSGGKQGIFAALFALIGKGDEVLIPEPSWLSYPDLTRMCDGIPKLVPCPPEKGFHPTVEDLKRYAGKNTRMVIVNSPNNPTGILLKEEFLDALARLAAQNNWIVLSDEVYNALIFDEIPYRTIAQRPGMKEHVLICNSFSKSFAVPGWRLSYLAGPEKWIGPIDAVQQNLMTCASSVAQAALVVALENRLEINRSSMEVYRECRRIVVEEARHMKTAQLIAPEGGFYGMMDIRKSRRSSEDAMRHLLENFQIATIPGNAYGPSGEGFLRICFAREFAELKEAMAGFKQAFG